MSAEEGLLAGLAAQARLILLYFIVLGRYCSFYKLKLSDFHGGSHCRRGRNSKRTRNQKWSLKT